MMKRYGIRRFAAPRVDGSRSTGTAFVYGGDDSIRDVVLQHENSTFPDRPSRTTAGYVDFARIPASGK